MPDSCTLMRRTQQHEPEPAAHEVRERQSSVFATSVRGDRPETPTDATIIVP